MGGLKIKKQNKISQKQLKIQASGYFHKNLLLMGTRNGGSSLTISQLIQSDGQTK